MVLGQRRHWVRALVLAVAAGSLLAAGGCGYCKNVSDDFRDCFIVGAGVTPPVVSTEEGTLVAGIFPPSMGLYVEATDLIHLGAICKASGDVESDRRGAGVVADSRVKMGLGPWRYVKVNQKPISVNDYKAEGNELDGWREHMRQMKDPLFHAPGKELIFRDAIEFLKVGEEPKAVAVEAKPARTQEEDWFGDWNIADPRSSRKTAAPKPVEPAPQAKAESGWGWPKLRNGWQNWQIISLEIAVPEPILTKTGFNVRFGFDISEMADFALSLVGLDLYSDAAYEWWSGKVKYGEGGRPVKAAEKR